MPVNETLQLRDELKGSGLALDRVIANGCYPKRFTVRDVRALRAAAEDGRSPLARSAMRAALSEEVRHRGQREQLARLEDGFGAAPARLPFVFAPALDRDALVSLSETLEDAL
jgi:DnaJ-domain-containing protein 1